MEHTKSTQTPDGVRNKTVSALGSALGILGNRSCATVNADMRVGRMLTHVTPAVDTIKRAKNRVVLEAVEGLDLSKLSPLEQMVLKARIETKHAEIDDAICEGFTLPTGVLRQDDLPKEKIGDNGWQNGAQLGAIVADLGPLFEFPKE